MKKIWALPAGLTVLAMVFMQTVSAQTTWYVATNGTGNGSSWANATNNIQGAINASGAGDTVLVSNGVYLAGGLTNYPAGTLLTNRVAIYKAIIVRSANNDPTNTIIKGAWATDGNTNGPDAVRCVYLANGSSLIGFMLTNGATRTNIGGTYAYDGYGGGLLGQSTNTVVSNCIVTGNAAGNIGGGAAYVSLYNCALTGNSAGRGGGAGVSTLYYCGLIGNGAFTSASGSGGGGAYAGTLYYCALTENSAYYGGGVNESTLYNCTVVSNSAATQGGGAYKGTLYNCTVASNSAPTGGGTRESTLYSCMVVGNSAASGGGTSIGALYNCAVVGNFASSAGGGVRGGNINNCIVYFNNAPAGTNWELASTVFTNSCTITAQVGWATGNITNDPMFTANGSGYGTNHAAGNYRLRMRSPCVNTGTNFSWMTDPADPRSRDLDGNQRIYPEGGTVDMGAYETLLYGLSMFKVY